MSRYSVLRSTFSTYPARYRARRVYFAANDLASGAHRNLAGHDGMTPAGRARILTELAILEQSMAEVLATAWPSPESRADATDLQASADLLELLASTEAAERREFRQHGPDNWEAAFGWILDDLADTPHPARRAELMVRLYLAVHLLLGSVVPETIAVVRTAYIDLALAKQQRAFDVVQDELSIHRTVNLISFGYLHAPEPDGAHHVQDLRPYRDPHVSPELRNLTANDQMVIDTVLNTPGIPKVLTALTETAYTLTATNCDRTAAIAIGCSGGRHRAPTVTNTLAERLRSHGFTVTVQHRDLHKPVVHRTTA